MSINNKKGDKMNIKQIEENTTYYRDMGKFPSLDEITFMEIEGQEILLYNQCKTIVEADFEDDMADIGSCVIVLELDDGSTHTATNEEFMEITRINIMFNT